MKRFSLDKIMFFVFARSREPVIIHSFRETYFHQKKNTPHRCAFLLVETTGLEPVTSRM